MAEAKRSYEAELLNKNNNLGESSQTSIVEESSKS
jgi:hypothetical protein